jgi:hypothetical protein
VARAAAAPSPPARATAPAVARAAPVPARNQTVPTAAPGRASAPAPTVPRQMPIPVSPPIPAEPVVPAPRQVRTTTGTRPGPGKEDAEPEAWAGPHSRRWQLALAALGALVLVAVCGLGSFLIMEDERQGADAQAAEPAPTAVARDISTRAADPTPLTAKEVFPATKITIPGTPEAYQVLKTQATKDCRVAADAELRKLISSLKCSQVVRATLRSPTKEYLITGGVLNLETADGAQQAKDKMQSMVDQNAGRFLGFMAGKETEPLALSATHVGWDTRGHYLVYCLIARADGKDFADNDPYARQILYDIVELHLRNAILEQRATAPVGGPN